MGALDISIPYLVACYALLAFPLAAILWLKTPILGRTITALVRMTVQLLLVGAYLHVVFMGNQLWLTGLWLLVMIFVADLSIVRGCGVPIRRFLVPMLIALATGTAIPLLYLTGVALQRSNLLDAQYAIPLGGMILGNCLRADIIGLKSFYHSLRHNECAYLQALAQGASLQEAIRPFLRDALRDALAPTIATMATIGLVSLPGMMTGVILGGNAPMTAVKYQIAIMLAIFSGTAITVVLGILLTVRQSFTPLGTLCDDVVVD